MFTEAEHGAGWAQILLRRTPLKRVVPKVRKVVFDLLQKRSDLAVVRQASRDEKKP